MELCARTFVPNSAECGGDAGRVIWALPDPEPVFLRSAVYFISSGAFPARLQTLSREPGTWGMEGSHPIPHSDITALIF